MGEWGKQNNWQRILSFDLNGNKQAGSTHTDRAMNNETSGVHWKWKAVRPVMTASLYSLLALFACSSSHLRLNHDSSIMPSYARNVKVMLRPKENLGLCEIVLSIVIASNNARQRWLHYACYKQLFFYAKNVKKSTLKYIVH